MRKRIVSVITACVLVLSLAACGQTAQENNVQEQTEAQAEVQTETEAETQTQTEVQTETETQTDPPTEIPSETPEETPSSSEESAEGSNVLIAYFSWSGNTEEMASYIAQQTGGDLYEIEPKVPYPEDYNEAGDVAKAERDENARPEIANLPESIEGYDTIFIGYPIWWHTAPMVIGTFLENYDLSGLEVYPFTQSASMNTEQFENSMDFVREAAGAANVHDGLFVGHSDTEAIDNYLTENGFSK